ncbi:hypothetical protein ABIG06_000073 [Bradyrhizobium sp. USDA 326]
MPGLRDQEVLEQPTDVVAQRVVRIHLDELLIVFRTALGHHVIISLACRTARQVGDHLHDRCPHRRAVGGNRGVTEEGEVARERGALPRDLPAARGLVDLQAHALEQLLDRHVGLARDVQEGLRIGAVAARAVERLGARRGRVADDGAVRCVDDGEAPAGVVDFWERVVAAGIEDDDAHPARDRLQRRHHVDETHRIVDELGGAGDLGVDGNEIVLAGELHAVTGVIDHRHRVGTARGDLGGKVLDHAEHVVLGQIGRGDHFEAGGVQELRHRLRVIVGIRKLRRVLVVRIADHQRHPLLRALQHGGGRLDRGDLRGNGPAGEAEQASHEAGRHQERL